MIRKLTEQDRKITLEFLSEEPAINLFIIGDIECFGFDKEYQEIWGSFDAQGELEGVLLRYHENYIPYYKNKDFNITPFKNIIMGDDQNKIICGKESIAIEFRDILENTREKSMYFCELREGSKLRPYSENIKTAKEEDAERIYSLLLAIEEFETADRNSVERIRNVIETKMGRIYFMENDIGEIITVSQTTAENSQSAMVVGVATGKEYRKKGFMSQCLSKLCHDVLEEGKTLCLFYDNPEAGSVYHALGFESIGRWMMIMEGRK